VQDYVRISPGAYCHRSNGIVAEVTVVEPTGSETQVSARAGGLTITAIFRDRVDLTFDQNVSLLPDIRRAHVFDTATGVRIP
jgi:multiple sugar transport system ATP-binding protein